MKRSPMEGTPFEMVKDENARVFMFCQQCAGYEYAYDALARDMLHAKKFGPLRVIALTPYAVGGMVRFFIRHVHCFAKHNHG